MDQLKPILNHLWNGNTVSAYLLSLAIIIAAGIAAKLIKVISSRWLRRLAEKTETKADDIALELVDRPLYWLLLVFGTSHAFNRLLLPERWYVWIHHAMVLASTVVVLLAASRLVHLLFDTYAVKLAERTESKMDDQLLPVLRRLLKGVLWSFAVLLILDNFGIDVMALVTGLGIGGLAVAMAAKDTLSNMIAGISIFMDQPFKVGDLMTVGGFTGTVEEVGLRTTRVRTFEGHLVTIPNASVANSSVENISERPTIRVRFNVGLTYDTTLDKCKEAVERIVEAVKGGVDVVDEPVVHFVAFGESTLDFQVTYYVETTVSLFDVKHAVNLAIKNALTEGDISMAFPTVTLDAPEGQLAKAA